MKIDRIAGPRLASKKTKSTPQKDAESSNLRVTDRTEISSPRPEARGLGQAAQAAAIAPVGAAVGGAIGATAGEHLRLIMVGPPGAGKGTQSRFLLEGRDGAHISTGAMLREEVANDTELGRKAKPYMDRGELVPDDIVLDMVRGRLEKEDSFILDGFPRSVPQAEALDEMLVDLKKPLTSIVLLEVSDETILNRLLKRGRADDNEETIRNRIEVYRQQTEPMIEYFRPQGLIESVNVEGSIEASRELVANRVAARLKGETPSLDVALPADVLKNVEAQSGPAVQELLDNLEQKVGEGKAPYPPSWTEEQREQVTEKTRNLFSGAVKSRPDLTLPELAEAGRLHTESETLEMVSHESGTKVGKRAAWLSAAAVGLGVLFNSQALTALGGVGLAGSLAFTAYSQRRVEEQKALVNRMAGTRDLAEGWSVSLKPPGQEPPEAEKP